MIPTLRFSPYIERVDESYDSINWNHKITNSLQTKLKKPLNNFYTKETFSNDAMSLYHNSNSTHDSTRR